MMTDMDERAVPLPIPESVDGRIEWLYTISIVVVHLLALLALLPWLFSWTGLIVMIVGIHVFGQGITICYHRLLTHRSFAVPLWLEHIFVIIALCCAQDTPARWVATHRYHHNHSDERPDPHSPLVSFLWGHMGWLMYRNAETQSLSGFQKYAVDLLRDPFYMKLEKNRFLQVWIYLAQTIPFYIAGALIGYLTAATGQGINAALQMGLSLVVWGVFVRTVAVWHITWSVNSLSHMFGYRTYETGEESTNNWLVALLTVGEGWHNNHHHDPASACNQHRWWEWDISYYEIKLLEKLGLAWKVNPPRHRRRESQASIPPIARPVGEKL